MENEKEYQLSIKVIAIIVAAGLALQVVAGNIHFDLLGTPVNIFIGGVIVLSIAGFAFFRGTPFFRWFSGISFSVTLLAAILVLCLFMGLIPQVSATAGDDRDPYAVLGLRRIASSWPFVLLYLTLLLSLGTLISRRMIRFRLHDTAFYLNHAGLWIFLFAAGLGTADRRQYTVRVPEGAAVSRGYMDGRAYPLPFSIRLHDFDMEEYPLDSIERRAGRAPMPKSYLSDVEICRENGRKMRARIEVNRPLTFGAWSVCQYGYDQEAGKYSAYSVLLVVYDPWIGGVYAGICLLAAGAIGMMTGRIRRRMRRTRLIAVSVCIAGMVAVFLLLYPQIRSSRLMPALQSQWFIPHVAAYIVSYALLGAATAASLFQLRKYRKGGAPDESLHRFTDRLVSAGFGFLMLGMLMGSVWAKEAWGHYWSWDPKETWALVTVATYLLYIHLRLRKRGRRYALYLLPVAFALLMVAWIGVNYLPAARHSVHVY
ncbi:MAG: cytochrome c biogenesis protein CcsA [Tannerella sp.]|jgi:ABC-type transport system involved in cytochrome c biogenesis permease subunit|nr:cytochrome c biogenesis protein CcsA [Tannerella sp.]